VKHRYALDGVADAEIFAPAPAGVRPSRWEPDEDATCSINYTSGTTARPKGVQLTHRNCCSTPPRSAGTRPSATATSCSTRCRCSTATAGACPMRSPPWAAATWCSAKIDGESILSRVEEEGLTLMCGAPAVVAAILDAAGARKADGRTVPAATDPHRGRWRAAPLQGHRARRDRARVGVHPDLRPHRDDAGDHREPRAHRMGRPRPAERARRQSRRACRPSASRSTSTTRVRSSPGQRGLRRLLAAARRDRKAVRDGWFHTGDGGYFDGPYVVIADRKKDVIITGGENVSSIEVEDCLYQHEAVAEVAVIGVPDERWGETIKALIVVARRPRGDRDRAHRPLPGAHGALQGPDQCRVPRGVGPHRHRQAAEVQAAPDLLGGH